MHCYGNCQSLDNKDSLKNCDITSHPQWEQDVSEIRLVHLLPHISIKVPDLQSKSEFNWQSFPNKDFICNPQILVWFRQ